MQIVCLNYLFNLKQTVFSFCVLISFDIHVLLTFMMYVQVHTIDMTFFTMMVTIGTVQFILNQWGTHDLLQTVSCVSVIGGRNM